VVLVLGLLAGGLICLLVVNTTLAANSLEISRLQRTNAARTERMQQLQQTVTADQSDAAIAQRARQLGMVPLSRPAFLDLRTHSIKIGNGATR
jgi:cell division protein FtsB